MSRTTLCDVCEKDLEEVGSGTMGGILMGGILNGEACDLCPEHAKKVADYIKSLKKGE